MKQVVYLLITIFIFIIQTTFVNIISIEGIKPNLLLLFVVTIGFLKGEYDGLYVGCAAGLMHDAFFASYIGGNLFLYAVIGFLVGIICREYFKGNVVTPMLVSAVSTFAFGIGNYILIILLRGFTNIGYYLFIKIVPEIIYNSIFMIFLYIITFTINSRFENKIKYKRKVF